MQTIIPRPLRDIVMAPYQAKAAAHAPLIVVESGKPHISPAEKMISAILRVILAAIGFFILLQPVNMALTAAILGVLSLPSVAIIVGSALLWYGGTAACAALAVGSFSSFSIGVGFFMLGWVTLEYHDIIPFWLAELGIKSIADNNRASLTQWLVR